jgi:hypothetical protein
MRLSRVLPCPVIGLLLVALSVGQQVSDASAAPPAAVDYLRDIKPILAARCFACHGPLKQQHNLRLDTAAAMRQGGESGPAVEPHDSEGSLLYRAVTGADGWQMPPEGEPLSGEQITKLKSWINAGAQAPADELPAADPRNHWAFRPPQRPAPPAVANARWARNPIDRFVAAEHEKHGVSPRPEAPRHLLLRRVYLDLIGLPPTADELESFLADASADAYEKVVDRLLASPQYAERWARHWMDIWRYSDWYGFGNEVRNSQPHIWRWRDWIIDSLAADKGYDQMIVEMLAGDELAPTDQATLRATGFLVRNWYKFNRNTWLQDTIEHTGKAFLAITFNCARCHDHKYDPISQEDYYHLRAFFEPHDVRTDFAGELDRGKAGLVRVYDAQADRPTYLFVRGDEREPDKSRNLLPALPAILCSQPLAISPVTLAPEAWYGGLDPRLQQAMLRAAADEVSTTQSKLSAAKGRHSQSQEQLKEAARLAATFSPPACAWWAYEPPSDLVAMLLLAAAQRAVDECRDDAAVAEQACRVALARLVSLEAKVAAERAKFAQPPDPAATALALAAGRAQRQAELEARQFELASARRQQALAQRNAFPGGQSDLKLDEAAASVKAATNALDAARAAALDPSPTYTPLDKVYPAVSTGRRLALARWIASRSNPLTARVAVNHIWRRHFGRPLVRTVFDFGMNGQPPSHPALLDWLAVEFMESGWRMKPLHRLIVTSAAYRLDSAGGDESNLRIDPDNRLVWRMNVRRADAEVIRDAVLRLAGDLDQTIGGPELDQATADATTRRSIYYRHANEKRVVFLELFDQPTVAEGYERMESIVPQQALALLNSRFAIEHARMLAEQLWQRALAESSAGGLPRDRFIRLAFRHVLARDPGDLERGECETFLAEQAGRLANPRLLTAFGQPPDGATKPEEPAAQARADFVQVLLNHNDFVTIR